MTNKFRHYLLQIKKFQDLLKKNVSSINAPIAEKRKEELNTLYSKAIDDYKKKVRNLGFGDDIIAVTGIIPMKKKNLILYEKEVQIYYINLSEEDVGLIIKRDYPNLKIKKIENYLSGYILGNK